MSIHDELERIAARAPEVVVPPGTWGRAQRARRRERYGVLAVVVVLVALAGTLAWLPTRDDGVDPARSDGLGVPDRLYAVPDRMSQQDTEGAWAYDQVTDDLPEVGVGAAAWYAGWGLVVVVDATRGDYHLLDPPDLLRRSAYDPGVALSPDGRHLAYAYAVVGPAAKTEPVPSGVRVVDLTTGEVREIPVAGEEGTAVNQVAWSPDGRWLAFFGTQQSWWTERGMGTSQYLDRAGPVLGRIGPDADLAEIRRVENPDGVLDIDDTGTVTYGLNALRTWDGGRTTTPSPVRPKVLKVLLGTLPDGTRVRLDAWSNPSSVQLRTTDGDLRSVIDLDPGVGRPFSLATALLEQPTVDRPEPDWPTDWEHVAMVGAWVLAGLAALALLVATIRLRARRSPYATPAAARPRPRPSK